MCKVSIIMPVFEVKKYIEDSIKSICVQKMKELELILVNDGTTDNSILLAENILKKCNIEYRIIDKKNSGLPSARNSGLTYARGEYVCFIDSDDIIDAKHLSRLYRCAIINNQVVCFSDFEETFEYNRYGKDDKFNGYEVISRNRLLTEFMTRKLKIHCCSLLIKRSYLNNNKFYFNEKLRYGEDIDFMWRLFPTLDSIGYVKCKSYKYLQRKNSLMSVQNINRVLILYNEFKKTASDLSNKYVEDKYIFKYLLAKALLAFLRTFAESSNYSTFKKLLRKIDYKKEMRKMYTFPNYEIRMLAIILLFNKKIFYILVKKIANKK